MIRRLFAGGALALALLAGAVGVQAQAPPPPPVPPGCDAAWLPVSGSVPAQSISGDAVVAAAIGPLNLDAFDRMFAATGGTFGLNAYFRAAIGEHC